MPKPFVPAVDFEGLMLRCRITLFGFADFWREVVRRALLRALAGGLRLKEEGGIRVPVRLEEGHWWRSESVAVPEQPERVRLLFATLLCPRATGAVKSELSGLVPALLDRACGLARWQDTGFDPDRKVWHQLAEDLRFERIELRPATIHHRSSRQPHHHRIVGFVGGFDIVRPPAALMPLLALGELAHVGARSAFGCGRYRMICYP